MSSFIASPLSSAPISNSSTYPSPAPTPMPDLTTVHGWTTSSSVISSIISHVNNLLICGTQNGSVLLFSLTDYTLQAELREPEMVGSNLCLDLCHFHRFLFVGGSDSLIKVYDLKSSPIQCIKIIYSSIDIGDIFSMNYCHTLKTLFIGCQNASIIWCPIDLESASEMVIDRSNLPHLRYDKFFDSTGPGGIINKIQYRKQIDFLNEMSLCEVDPNNCVSFAHYGYVYCLKVFQNEFMSLKFVGHDKFLVSGGGDGQVNIWGLRIENEQVALVPLHSLENEDSILSMHINQTYIYVGLSNGDINVWDLLTFQLIKSFNTSEQVNDLVALNNNLIYYGNKSGFNVISNGKQSRISDESTLTLHNYHDQLATAGCHSIKLYNLVPNAGDDGYHMSLDNESMVKNLGKLIQFKTISKYHDEFVDESRNCTKFLIKLLNGFGGTTHLLPIEGGNPIIISSFKADANHCNDSCHSILYYGHYDVVEARNENWNTDPFKMTSKNGFLYGRGTSDNKGPTLAVIYAVAELSRQKQLACDFTFVIEGEEEHGSFQFQNTILRHKQLIGDIDYILLSNSYWLDDERPCLNYGLRGVINFSINITSEKPDRHSGVDGGVSKEPTMDLVQLLNTLTKDNQIMIPNFYRHIKPISAQELDFFKAINEYNPIFKLPELIAKWTKPSLTIHKFEVSGPNTDTVIPKSVTCSVSIRIVPNQDVAEIKQNLVSYLTEQFDSLQSSNALEINVCHEVEPWLGHVDNKLYRKLNDSITKHWGVEPLLIREGGSIPSIRFLEKTFGAMACQVPCGQGSDNAHLHDEKLRVMNLYRLKDILKDTLQK